MDKMNEEIQNFINRIQSVKPSSTNFQTWKLQYLKLGFHEMGLTECYKNSKKPISNSKAVHRKYTFGGRKAKIKGVGENQKRHVGHSQPYIFWNP